MFRIVILQAESIVSNKQLVPNVSTASNEAKCLYPYKHYTASHKKAPHPEVETDRKIIT